MVVFCCTCDRERQLHDDVVVEGMDDKEPRLTSDVEVEAANVVDYDTDAGPAGASSLLAWKDAPVTTSPAAGAAKESALTPVADSPERERQSPTASGQGATVNGGDQLPKNTCASPEKEPAAGNAQQAHAAVSSSCSPDAIPPDILNVILEAEKLRKACFPFRAESQVFALVQQLQREKRLDVLEAVRQTQYYRDLVNEMLSINAVLETLLDDTGWTLQCEKGGIFVWTKPEKGTDLVTVRLAGLVEGPFKNFCSIGKEVGLIKSWMPGVKKSDLLAQLDPFSFIGYYTWQQMLFSTREFLIEEKCHVNDEIGYLVVKRGPPAPGSHSCLPPEQKGVVRAGISNWCSFSQPLGKKDGRCFSFAVSVCNVDLQVPLPTWLVNKLSINIGYESFLQLRVNVKGTLEPGNAFAKSIENPNNKDYYERLEALEKNVEGGKTSPARRELLQTGWVKDPNERRKMFERAEGQVLVPMSTPNAL